MNQHNNQDGNKKLVFYLILFTGGITYSLFSVNAISIIIGIVLFLFVVIFFRKQATSQHQTTKKCNHCGSRLSPDDTFCRNCGKAVTKQHVCEYCGTVNEEDATYCTNCNAYLK